METNSKYISENQDNFLPHLTYLDVEDIHLNYAEEENAHTHNTFNKSEDENEIGRNFNEEDFI